MLLSWLLEFARGPEDASSDVGPVPVLSRVVDWPRGGSVLPFFFLGFFSFPLSVPLFLLIKRSLHILF